MTGLFVAAIPIAGVLGGPLSGLIMGSMGGRLGLANWQWLFLLEGLPSVMLGLTTFAVLADKPSQARWLSEAQRRQVLADLEADNREAGPRQHDLMRALANPLVWLLTIIQFCLTSAIPTVGFWSPTIIQGLGVQDDLTIGLLFAVQNIIAVICLIVVSRHSDRTLERRYHSALPCLACAIGLASIGFFSNQPPVAFAALVLATLGPVTASASFWQFPSMLLAGTAAAGGIALINSIGSFSGWVAPFAIGWLRDLTGTTSAGLYVVSGLELIAGVLILLYMPRQRRRMSSISVEAVEANVQSR